MHKLARACLAVLVVVGFVPHCLGDDHQKTSSASAAIPFAVRLDHPGAQDQDDLCFWLDLDDPLRSLAITSDKKADIVAVYDLQGNLLQQENVPHPGNIDIRQHVLLGNERRDLVVVNQRSKGPKLVMFQVDRARRRLKRLDQGDLQTGPNYGLCLYHSRIDGALYVITTSESGRVDQFRLLWTAASSLSHELVRSWNIGKCEGAVADDDMAVIYIAEENRGVWKLGAEPDQPVPGQLILRLGENGLEPDVEGLTIVKTGPAAGYLIVSSQGSSRFFVYRRSDDHAFLGNCAIDGARETDGIDVLIAPLGNGFSRGVFGCHTAATKRCGVLLTPWDAVEKDLNLPAAE